MTANGEKALVLLSGGQDSTTCLYWALDRFARGAVATISFDYGQMPATVTRMDAFHSSRKP